MIIRGNPAGNVGFWSQHLLRVDHNEKCEVKEITGLLATDLPGALREMQGVASGSRCGGNFMYQANINPYAHERLSPDQWKDAVDRLEKNLGLEGHQRVVIEHVKNGRQHCHIVWNRVDIETMKVADMGGNWITHKKTSRELENEFGLTKVRNEAEKDREKKQQLWETRAAERSGIDPKSIKAELTKIWNATETGMAFKEEIEKKGYILAKGDRRDFCVVDRAGDAHSLARRLEGAKAADVRARMVDVDRDALPTVQEAREKQRATPPREATEQKHGFENKTAKSVSAEAALDASLKVADAVTGVVEKLTDFVAEMIIPSAPPPKRDPHAARVDNLIAQRRAQAALERIRHNVERGKPLRGEDVQNLTPDHIENIKARGDDYVRDLIRRMEESRERDRGRERER